MGSGRSRPALGLGGLDLLDQRHILGAGGCGSLHSSSSTGIHKVQKLGLVEVQQLLELKTTESQLLELSLLTKGSDLLQI